MTANSKLVSDLSGQSGTPRAKLVSTLIMLGATELLLPLLFPPFYCFFLAPVALVPAVTCILRRPMNWRYLLLYYATGVLFFAINLYWLGPVTVAGMIALSFYVGLYFPLFAFGVHRLVLHLRLPATIAVPLVWTATEFMRASFFQGGFPWFILGHCLAPVPALIQAADLFGVWGLTFMITLLNGFVVDLLRLPLMQPRVPRQFNPALVRLCVTTLVLIVATASYSIFRLNERTTTPGPLICTIQGDISQSRKNDPNSSEDIWREYVSITLDAVQREPNLDLLVWPETMVPGLCNSEYLKASDADLHALAGLSSTEPIDENKIDEKRYNEDEKYRSYLFWRQIQLASRRRMESLTKFSTQRNVPMLLGIGALAPQGSFDDSLKQNRTVLVLPGREVVEEYSKVHLVPFGEFVPFREVRWLHDFLKWLIADAPDNDPGRRWTRFVLEHPEGPLTTLPGASPTPGGTKRWTFGTPICFEDTMPYPARNMVSPWSTEAAMIADESRRKADFLVNVSNDGWFMSVELDQHLQACILRAVENRIPIVRSVNTGNSGFIDSCGRVVQLVRGSDGRSTHSKGFAIQRMEMDSRISLYTRLGDLFPIVCGILSTLAVGWTLVRPRKGRPRESATDH